MKRPHKYRAKPITVDGYRFDSQAEARRYGELKLLERAGQISDLELQPTITCTVNGIVVCRYRADFRYRDKAALRRVIEDVKSPATAKEKYYRLKRRLVEAVHPDIQIREVLA